MSSIRTLTSLPVNSLIRARIRARNSEGWGVYSDVNTAGATVETAPLAITTLTQDDTQLSNTQVYLQWTAPTASVLRGGYSVSITGYAVYWKQTPSASDWTLIADNLSTTYLLVQDSTATPLESGQTASFKVVAINKYGYGPIDATTSLSVLLGQAPDAPAAPSTSVPSTGSSVLIEVTAPADNAYAITAYQVQVLTSDGTTWADATSYCTGTTCSVPMADLRTTPYSLAYNDDVVARARAQNSRGWSSWSASSTTTGKIQTEPAQMAAVTATTALSSTVVEIKLDWTALSTSAETGGSAVTSYSLYWN